MDKLLKQAVDSNVVGFKDRFKGKMQDHFDSAHVDITKKVAADMAGVEPMEEEEDDLNESIKSAIEDADLGGVISRKGKSVVITWKKVSGIQPKELEDRLKKELKPHADKIKFIGVKEEGGGAVANIDLK